MTGFLVRLCLAAFLLPILASSMPPVDDTTGTRGGAPVPAPARATFGEAGKAAIDDWEAAW